MLLLRMCATLTRFWSVWARFRCQHFIGISQLFQVSFQNYDWLKKALGKLGFGRIGKLALLDKALRTWQLKNNWFFTTHIFKVFKIMTNPYVKYYILLNSKYNYGFKPTNLSSPKHHWILHRLGRSWLVWLQRLISWKLDNFNALISTNIFQVL